jgi:hypothetical protein
MKNEMAMSNQKLLHNWPILEKETQPIVNILKQKPSNKNVINFN